jgi:hypothetical protein
LDRACISVVPDIYDPLTEIPACPSGSLLAVRVRRTNGFALASRDLSEAWDAACHRGCAWYRTRNLRPAGNVGDRFSVVRGVFVAAAQMSRPANQTMRNSQPAIAITTAIR